MRIPSGWSKAPIGSICTLQNGRAFKASDWEKTGLPIVRIQNLNNPDAQYNHFQGAVEAKNKLRGGELLFAWSGTPGTSFGAHIWHGSEAVLNQHIFRVDFDERYLDKRFFRHAINQRLAELIDTAHGGVGLRHVTKGKFEATDILVPPRKEQMRIADKLDALLARVDACRERLDRVPGILKRFRQSVLAAAASGELTREWREERGLQQDWRQTLVVDVATQVFDGPFGSHLKSKDYADEGVRVVRLENIGPLRFIEEKRTYIPQEKYESLMRHTLFAGDILFSSFVDEEVRVCLLPEQLDGQAINKADCFCIRTNIDHCRPGFLALRLACRETFEALDDVIHGATRPRINLSQLRTIVFELPSLDEQDEIVRRSSTLLDQADALELRLRMVRACVDRMAPSSLAKAFRGELVPQDPSDEPASDLLARI